MPRKHFSDWLNRTATLPTHGKYWMTLTDLAPYLGYKSGHICAVNYQNGRLDWLPAPQWSVDPHRKPYLLFETLPTLRALVAGRPNPGVGSHALPVYPPATLVVVGNPGKSGETVPRCLDLPEIPEGNEAISIWLDEIESAIWRLTGYVRVLDFDPPLMPNVVYKLADPRKHYIRDPLKVEARKAKSRQESKVRRVKRAAANAAIREAAKAIKDKAAAHRARSLADLKGTP